MIDYGTFQFASPPRTATAWFRKAAAVAGLGDRSSEDVHTPHTPDSGCLTVSMTRHPVDLLASYYAAIEGVSVSVPIVDLFNSFEEHALCLDDFIDSYLNRAPGAVGEMFRAYNADSVLRLEDLPWAAMELFETAGTGHLGLLAVEQIPPQNVFNGTVAIISDGHRRRILDAESEFCEEYGYW